MDGFTLIRRKVDPRALARPDLGNIYAASITVKPPMESPQKIKKTVFARVLPFAFAAVIIGMLVVMVITGRRQLSPYMFMMPLAMIGGLIGFNLHGGGGEGDSIAELDAGRKEYYNYLKEVRKDVHRLARQQFLLQQYYFPDPIILNAIIDRDEFWCRQANITGTLGGRTDKCNIDPYLSLRLGVAKVHLQPPLETQKAGPMDYLEPVTAIAFRRFMRTQSFINSMPVAINLLTSSCVYFAGEDDNRIRALVRAFIVGISVTHSPEHILIVMISAHLREYWDFLKWLPHAQHPSLYDASGSLRLVFPTLEEAFNKLSTLLEGRVAWTKSASQEITTPLIIVILDRNLTAEAKLGQLSSNPLAGIVLLDLSAPTLTSGSLNKEIKAIAGKENYYFLDGDELHTAKYGIIQADDFSLHEAQVIARKLAPYRISSTSSIADQEEKNPSVELGFLAALGVDDPGTFDPRLVWEKNSQRHPSELLKFPIGIKYENTQTPAGEYVYLDIKEAALGGIGPHGVVQGMTGTGKSYLLRGWILSALTLYPPEEINFICVDFKGYTTFQGLAGVPHIISIITNMEEEADLMERFADVIDGEIMRRQKAFRETKTTDYVSYTKLREKDATIPPMPALIVMLDETQQFLKAHPDYKQKFESWGAIGRSLRIHIVLCQQTYDSGIVGGFDIHRTYGISLTASSERASNQVVGSPNAAHLPRPGWAILYGDERSQLFRSFNISKVYIPASERDRPKLQYFSQSHSLQIFDVVNEANIDNTHKAEDEIDAHPRKDTSDITESGFSSVLREDAVLADRLSQFGDRARQMWLPPLNFPVTFADLPISSQPTFTIPLGLSDAPKMHNRPPFYIDFASAYANVRIIGTTNAGKSMCLQTIILGLSLVQSSTEINFYIIDNGGGKLAYLEKLPHVGGYARPNDIAAAIRIAGEFIRLINLRKELFYLTQSINIGIYLARKREDPELMQKDPYGRMFIVVDGWKTFRNLAQQAAGIAGTAISDPLLTALRDGNNYGIHIIITIRQENDLNLSLQELFRSTILLNADEASGLSIEAKAIFKQIPARCPGRGVNIKDALHMRIAIPQLEALQELDPGMKATDVYHDQYDYSAGTLALLERICYKYATDKYAPWVEVLGHHLVRSQFINQQTRTEYPGKIIIGMAESDARLRTLPQNAANFIFYGDPQSGKTTVLKNYMQNLLEQYTNNEIRFIIIDFQRSLLMEREFLQKHGYLNAYATNFTETEQIARQIDQFMRIFRTMSADISMQQIADKTWWNRDFPYHLYIIVDDYHLVTTSQGNPLSVLSSWAAISRDVGIHFVIARNAGSIMRTVNDRLLMTLADINTPVMLLSGPTSEKILGSRFAHRKPGQGELIDPATGMRDVIQNLWIENLQ